LGDDASSLCETDPSACGSSATGAPEILLTGQLAGAPAVRRHRESVVTMLASAVSLRQPAAAPSSVPTPLPAGKRPGLTTTFFDIEAHLEIEVSVVADGMNRVLTLVRAMGGELVNESIEDKASAAGASLSLRVPSERVHEFLDALRSVGRMRSRRVEST